MTLIDMTHLLELKGLVDAAIEMGEIEMRENTAEDIEKFELKYPKGTILLGPFVIMRNRFI